MAAYVIGRLEVRATAWHAAYTQNTTELIRKDGGRSPAWSAWWSAGLAPLDMYNHAGFWLPQLEMRFELGGILLLILLGWGTIPIGLP